MAQFVEGWEEKLSKEDKQKVEWIRTHKAAIYASVAPADPLHDLPEEIVLEVIIDRHSMFKIRGGEHELSVLVHHAYTTVKNMFDFVRDR